MADNTPTTGEENETGETAPLPTKGRVIASK